MPEYRLGGIHVNFPFPAYDCQLVYMERVIEALQQVYRLSRWPNGHWVDVIILESHVQGHCLLSYVPDVSLLDTETDVI